MLGFHRTYKFVLKTHPIQPCILKFVTTSTNSEFNASNEVNCERQFTQPQRKIELKPFTRDFITSLFTGLFDENYIEYPSIHHKKEIDLFRRHINLIEKFLNKGNGYKDPVSSLEELKARDLFGLRVPQIYGGLNYSEMQKQMVLECLVRNHHLAHFVTYQENFCKILTLAGSQEQKLSVLPKLSSGDYLGCFAALESAPLVDFTSFSTVSLYDKNKKNIILNGSKMWVPYADVADFIIILSKVCDSNNINDEKDLFHFYLIDKNTPGVKIQKLDTTKHDDLYPTLYKIDIENAVLSESNILGNPNENVLPLFYSVLSSNFLSYSAICLGMLKNLHYSALLHCQTDDLNNSFPIKNLQEFSIGSLSLYIYVIESLIYLVSGRLDELDKPNIFLESCAAKVLSVDLLYKGIQKYIEIVGNKCYQPPSLLMKALSIFTYYSNMDDKQFHLKAVIGSEGIVSAVKADSEMRKKVGYQRIPYLEPGKAFLSNIISDKRRLKNYKKEFKYHNEVYSGLKHEADVLEQSYALFRRSIESYLTRFGNDIIKPEYHLIKFGEMAATLFALNACISRASSSCLSSSENTDYELPHTACLSVIVKQMAENFYNDMKMYVDCPPDYRLIGESCFFAKQYPVQHPLTRAF